MLNLDRKLFQSAKSLNSNQNRKAQTTNEFANNKAKREMTIHLNTIHINALITCKKIEYSGVIGKF